MKIELIGFDFELNPNNKMDILVDAVNASDADLILFPGRTIRDLNDLLYAEQDIKNKSSVAILELEESLPTSCMFQRNALFMMHGGLFFDLYTRYDDSPMIHTKGTAEYPNFIKMLMYLIGAEDIRR